MGLIDKVKSLTAGKDHKLKEAVDKAAHFVDDKTHGKYSEKIGKGTESAHRLIGRLEGAPPAEGGAEAGPSPAAGASTAPDGPAAGDPAGGAAPSGDGSGHQASGNGDTGDTGDTTTGPSASS